MAHETTHKNQGVQGKIVQCIGAVVDVEFPRDRMPRVYDALKLEGTALTLEVQQQLGDGIVRTIALGTSDGLRRGLMVTNTGAAITVPVGKGTLGTRKSCWRTSSAKRLTSAGVKPGASSA